MSAIACGCDFEENHQCERHAASELLQRARMRDDMDSKREAARMASRENSVTSKPECDVAADSWTRPDWGNGNTPQTVGVYAPLEAGKAAIDKSAQQSFATGATRSGDDHKIDYEGHLSPDVLQCFGEYMHAHRIQRDGQRRASDNWQEGIPMHKYVKSLIRHVFDLWRVWRGSIALNPDTGKPQTLRELCCAILFNTQGLLHELLESGKADEESMDSGLRKAIEAEGNPQEPIEESGPIEHKYTCPVDGEVECCTSSGYIQCCNRMGRASQ